jgi:hypothetical protein
VPAIHPLMLPGPSLPPLETSPIAQPDAEFRGDAYFDAGPPIVPGRHQDEPGSSPAQGLVRLVLTLVKLLHEVLERQAVRDAQIEDIGTALFAQAEELLRLQLQFGFSDKDLSLDLGVPERAL